jgi:hypothetical protein
MSLTTNFSARCTQIATCYAEMFWLELQKLKITKEIFVKWKDVKNQRLTQLCHLLTYA